MAKHLTEQEVSNIAQYTRIGLTSDELTTMTQDLNGILDGFDVFEEYDLEGVKPTFHPIGSLSNVMRDDVEVVGFTQKEALANAPQSQDGSFLIPSILGAEGEEN